MDFITINPSLDLDYRHLKEKSRFFLLAKFDNYGKTICMFIILGSMELSVNGGGGVGRGGGINIYI